MDLRFYTFTLLVIMNFNLTAQKETHLFNIIHNDKVIGTLKAVKETTEEGIIYTDHTIISTHIFTKIEVKYSFEAIYSDNEMTKSNVVIMLNGHQRTKTITEREKNVYTFYKDDSKENEIDKIIKYSSIMLLFNEPENISKVYAEDHGAFHDLKKIKDNEYLKVTPDGKKNKYIYENDSLIKAEIHAGMVNFEMVRTLK